MKIGFKHTMQTGFTLIEVLVTLGILGIALSAILKSALIIQEGLLNSQKQSQTAQIANLLFSRIQAKGYELSAYQGEMEQFPGWSWRANIYPTPEQEIRKLVLKIIDPDGKTELDLNQLFLSPSRERP